MRQRASDANMTDVSALLAQAKEHQERHESYRKLGVECLECAQDWPCPDRVFADGVIAALESLAARDTQIRKHVTVARDEAYRRAGEMDAWKDWHHWKAEGETMDAILALLDPEKDAT